MKNIISGKITKKILVSFVVVAIGILSYMSVLDVLLKKTYIGEPHDTIIGKINEEEKRCI